MYAEAIRKKVIDLLVAGKTQESVGKFLGIHPRTIRHWVYRFKKEGTLTPQTHGPRQRKINKEALYQYVQEHPDKTLKEMREVFHVCPSALFACLKKMSFTLKKNR
jgi:transposase